MPKKRYCLTKEGLESLRKTSRKNRPWLKSTGAKTPQGKKMSSLNAFKHGGRSRLIARLPALIQPAPTSLPAAAKARI
jgi:hypothetical protein